MARRSLEDLKSDFCQECPDFSSVYSDYTTMDQSRQQRNQWMANHTVAVTGTIQNIYAVTTHSRSDRPETEALAREAMLSTATESGTDGVGSTQHAIGKLGLLAHLDQEPDASSISELAGRVHQDMLENGAVGLYGVGYAEGALSLLNKLAVDTGATQAREIVQSDASAYDKLEALKKLSG